MLEAKMNAESLHTHVLHPETGGRDVDVSWESPHVWMGSHH